MNGWNYVIKHSQMKFAVLIFLKKSMKWSVLVQTWNCQSVDASVTWKLLLQKSTQKILYLVKASKKDGANQDSNIKPYSSKKSCAL